MLMYTSNFESGVLYKIDVRPLCNVPQMETLTHWHTHTCTHTILNQQTCNILKLLSSNWSAYKYGSDGAVPTNGLFKIFFFILIVLIQLYGGVLLFFSVFFLRRSGKMKYHQTTHLFARKTNFTLS